MCWWCCAAQDELLQAVFLLATHMMSSIDDSPEGAAQLQQEADALLKVLFQMEVKVASERRLLSELTKGLEDL